MLSSSEVAQMMGQQNQLFASQAAFSHQISQQMSPYGNGTEGGGFSYGGSGSANLGSDFGSRVGGGATSALGGAANFALSAGTVMGGFGMLGKTGRAMLDPFAGGGAGWGFAKSRGMGFAGKAAFGAIGAAPVFTGIMAAGKAIGSAITGAQEQAQVEQVLGGVTLGGGEKFGRSGAKHIGNMMREMQALPEMMTSMQELTGVMDKMNQVGMMSGAAGVTDFGRKFKDGIKTLKTMSQVMGSSMEEALPMFAEIQSSGFYSQASIINQTMKRQVVGGITGMGQGQVAQTAMSGSQMGHAMGGTRAAGASHALRVAAQMGVARSMGIIGEDEIREMTGMGGSQGLQALSNQYTETSYRMARGRTGKAYTAALAETDDDGRFTGRMDERKMERFRSGQYDTKDIRRMSRAALKSKTARMSWRANPGLTAEMASNLGAEGQFAMMENALGEKGFDDPDAAVIVGQKFGMSAREAKQRMGMARSMGNIDNQTKLESTKIARKLAQQAVMKENFSMDAVKSRISKRIEGVVAEPLKRLGSSIRDNIASTVDDFVDDLTGKYKVTVSEGLSKLYTGSMMGLGDSQKRFEQLRLDTGAMRSKIQGIGADMTAGTAARGAAWLGGTETAGAQYADRIRNIVGEKGMTEFSDGGSIRSRRARGEHILSADKNFLSSDKYTSVSQEELDKGYLRMQNIGADIEDPTITGLREKMSPDEKFAVQARASYIETTSEYRKIKDPMKQLEYKARKMRDSGIYKKDDRQEWDAHVRPEQNVSGLGHLGGGAIDIMAAAGALTNKNREGAANVANLTHIGMGGMADFASETEDIEKKFMKGLTQAQREAWETMDEGIGSGSNKFLRDVMNLGRQEKATRSSSTTVKKRATDTFVAMEKLRLSGVDIASGGRWKNHHENQGAGGGFNEWAVKGQLDRIALKASQGDPITDEDAALVSAREDQYKVIERQKMGQTSLKALEDGKSLTPRQKQALEDDYDVADPDNMSMEDIAMVKGKLDASHELMALSGDKKVLGMQLWKRTASQGISTIFNKTKLEGVARRSSIRSLRKRGVLGKGMDVWLDRFEDAAQQQSKTVSNYNESMGRDASGKKVKDNWSEANAGAISDLISRRDELGLSKKKGDKEELEDLEGMVDELSKDERWGATYRVASSIRSRAVRGTGKNKRGATMEQMFGKGFAVSSGLDQKQIDAFEKKHFGGEGGTLQAEDEFGNKLSLEDSSKALEAAMQGKEMSALSAASGTETKSKYASEAAVAEKMTEFVGEVNKLATIISGKKPEGD